MCPSQVQVAKSIDLGADLTFAWLDIREIVPFFLFVPCVSASALSNAHAHTVFSAIFPFALRNVTSARPSEQLVTYTNIQSIIVFSIPGQPSTQKSAHWQGKLSNNLQLSPGMDMFPNFYNLIIRYNYIYKYKEYTNSVGKKLTVYNKNLYPAA